MGQPRPPHPPGIDNHRRPLYTRTGIAHAEQTTRARALRLVGIGTD